MVEPEILGARARAQQLFSMADIEAGADRMAGAITDRLAGSNPLLLAVMTGGIVPTAMLLTRLDFPLQVDYIHLTRYGEKTSGGDLAWVRQPPASVKGRKVLLVDDLLDHGVTLDTAARQCRELGASEVLTAVLIVKQVEQRAGLQQTDFYGLTSPDRYLFGAGMDYKTYWRNGPGIFAVTD